METPLLPAASWSAALVNLENVSRVRRLTFWRHDAHDVSINLNPLISTQRFLSQSSHPRCLHQCPIRPFKRSISDLCSPSGVLSFKPSSVFGFRATKGLAGYCWFLFVSFVYLRASANCLTFLSIFLPSLEWLLSLYITFKLYFRPNTVTNYIADIRVSPSWAYRSYAIVLDLSRFPIE